MSTTIVKERRIDAALSIHITKTITQTERERRIKAQNRRKKLQDARRKVGLCTCGAATEVKVKTGRKGKMCPTCQEQARIRSYAEGSTKPPLKVAVLDRRLRDSKGVRRRFERDGLGREAWWWIANINIDGKMKSRRWSVTAHGDRKARALAQAQVCEWREMYGK